MTEQSILNLLLGDSSDNIEEKLDDINPLLVPNAAAKISSALAKNLNETCNNPLYPSHHWRESLTFIHKLCMRDGGHHHVNPSNKSLILEELGKSYQENETSDILQNCVREVQIATETFTDITKNYNNEVKQEYNLIWESIHQDLKLLEKSSGLEFNLPIRKKSKVQSSMNKVGNKDVEKEEMNSDHVRLKDINFGYAVLNVGNDFEITTHLTILLNKLSEYEEMHSYEKFFCKYLLKYLDRYPTLLEFFRDKLFFVIEMQLIDLCTILIKYTNQEFELEQRKCLEMDDLQNLISVCKLDSFIYFKITNVLYTLYCFSRFNTRILGFLKHISSVVSGME